MSSLKGDRNMSNILSNTAGILSSTAERFQANLLLNQKHAQHGADKFQENVKKISV